MKHSNPFLVLSTPYWRLEVLELIDITGCPLEFFFGLRNQRIEVSKVSFWGSISTSISQGRSQTGLTVVPYFIVINFHVSRFGLTVAPAACIVIGLHASPTVGCVKRVTTVITVLTPPSLACGNQPNYGFNMAAVIAFQAIFDSCVSLWIFILTFPRSNYCLSF